MSVKLRPWDGAHDTTEMQRLASRHWPLGLHPGGLGWAVAIEQLANEIVLAEDPDIVGWAGLTSGELQVQADSANPEVARTLLQWALERTEGHEVALTVPLGDHPLRAAAMDAGFTEDSHADPLAGMVRGVTAERATVPRGYRIRSFRDDESADRVEVHRSAWLPSALPWPPGDRPPISPDLTSSFTANHYDAVRRTWLYAQDLDLVVEAPDGSLAACCIVWWDAQTGTSEIEPLGVVPEHRRRGLAGSLCLEAVAQTAKRGGKEVFINTSPYIEYSTPAAAYTKVGFEAIKRDILFRRF